MAIIPSLRFVINSLTGLQEEEKSTFASYSVSYRPDLWKFALVLRQLFDGKMGPNMVRKLSIWALKTYICYLPFKRFGLGAKHTSKVEQYLSFINLPMKLFPKLLVFTCNNNPTLKYPVHLLFIDIVILVVSRNK